MKSKIISAFLAASIAGTVTMDNPALAKAYFAGKSEMVQNSEIIAVVSIKTVEKTKQKSTNWTYSEKARATVDTVLKGKPGRELEIYGGEDFICARCSLKNGKALVFLNHNGDLLTGSNWHLSIRPIEKNTLEWFDGENFQPLKTTPLPVVLDQIKSMLPKSQKLTAPLNVLFDADSLDDQQVGEGGGPSKYRQAFEKALPVASQHMAELQYMTEAGSPAGRVYAAMLLYHADKEKGKAALVSLCRCNGTVKYRSGCEIMPEGIWKIGEKLYSDGKYLTFDLH